MWKLLLPLFLLCNSGSLPAQTPIPGQYIVVLKESVVKPVIKEGLPTDRVANRPNKELREQTFKRLALLQAGKGIDPSAILYNYADALVGFSARLPDAKVIELRNDPGIAGVYQDHTLTLGQSVHAVIPDAGPSQIEDCAILTAGGHTDGSSKFTWIWIIDTGIDTDHPDLNVQVKEPYAKTFIGSSFEDLHGHGTHVAGIAGAIDNGLGVVGISAGAKLVPVKAIDDIGNTNFSLVLAAINHVAQYSIPGDVVNLSLGGFVPDCGVISYPALPAAIVNLANAGVWVSLAAGNDNNNATMYLPGCINNSRVFTVAALDCNISCAAYTNLGSNIDWYAIGTNVYSTYKDGGYALLSGTSMASPVVAGIIHSRGQAPVRGALVTCQHAIVGDITKPIAQRQ